MWCTLVDYDMHGISIDDLVSFKGFFVVLEPFTCDPNEKDRELREREL